MTWPLSRSVAASAPLSWVKAVLGWDVGAESVSRGSSAARLQREIVACGACGRPPKASALGARKVRP